MAYDFVDAKRVDFASFAITREEKGETLLFSEFHRLIRFFPERRTFAHGSACRAVREVGGRRKKPVERKPIEDLEYRGGRRP